jgi:polyphosphate kinase
MQSRPAHQRSDTTQARTPQATGEAVDLSDSKWYLNRELTWLEFNRRVLHEAWDPRTPLLERVKFLAIVKSNVDEFFMKRIGGLILQFQAGVQKLSVDGRTPAEQVELCHASVRELKGQQRTLSRELLSALADEGIQVIPFAALTPGERSDVRERYRQEISPLITPLAMDPAHPFPFVSNPSLNLLIRLCEDEASEPDPRKSGATNSDPGNSDLTKPDIKKLGKHYLLARVKVPIDEGISRFVPVGTGTKYIALEDVISNNLDLLFPDMSVESCELFRVTRNAIGLPREEQAQDLMAIIEIELRDRKFAPIIRLEVSR